MAQTSAYASEIITGTEQQLTQARTGLNEAARTDNVVGGLADRFKNAFGLSEKRTEDERKEDLQAARKAEAQAGQDLEAAKRGKEGIEKAAETVHTYPPEYFVDQVGVLERLLESIQGKDVPLAVTEKMRKALVQQDALQAYVRELAGKGYDLDPMKTLPIETYQRVRQQTVKQLEHALD